MRVFEGGVFSVISLIVVISMEMSPEVGDNVPLCPSLHLGLYFLDRFFPPTRRKRIRERELKKNLSKTAIFSPPRGRLQRGSRLSWSEWP